ncbi:MAG: TIGR01777 family protein [Crocinitomicaceae bacterium]|nr:TIGR01777 family protein [Crocinitomicaceae bacterium]
MDGNTKHILIAGGRGFLGLELHDYFQSRGLAVKLLTRRPRASNEVFWDGKHLGEWMKEIEWADILINLAGKSVNCRYTDKNKAEILSSRIDTTAILCQAVSQASNPPALWINSSSATTYVHSEYQQMTEDEGIIGDDFSMNVCKKWETEFFSCNLEHTRRVATRTSIVLGKSGGALPMLRRLTRFFLGGKQGGGNQYFSWIHFEDYCRAIDFIINNPGIVGPVNVTSPNPVKNEHLMKKLRKTMKVPFGIPQPKWLLELGARVIGTETELLLKSRNVVPERLLENGFEFKHPDIESALKGL